MDFLITLLYVRLEVSLFYLEISYKIFFEKIHLVIIDPLIHEKIKVTSMYNFLALFILRSHSITIVKRFKNN